MRLLRMLMGMRSLHGAGSTGGMLLVMMALAGLLSHKAYEGPSRDRHVKS